MAQLTTRKRVTKKGEIRWEYRFEGVTTNGKRHQISKSGFRTKREADIAGNAAYKRYYETGEVFVPSKRSLRDVGNEWLEKFALPGRSESTQDLRRTTFRKLDKALGKLPISSVTPRQITEWYNYYRLEGYSQTVLHQLSEMTKRIFAYAKKQGMIAVDPVERCDFEKSIQTPKPHVAYTAEELQDMLNMFAFSDHRRLFLAVAMFTGARESEVSGLSVSDDDGSSVTISKQINNTGDGRWRLGPTKTKKSRVVTYGETLKKEIEIAKKQIKERKALLGDAYKTPMLQKDGTILVDTKKGEPIELLCPYWDGAPMGRNTIKSISDRICKKYKDFSFHQLRHSHASLLIANGASPVEVATRLGHSTTKTTMDIYAHSMLAQQKGLADKVEEIMTIPEETPEE